MFEIVETSKVYAQIHLPKDYVSALTKGQTIEVEIHRDHGTKTTTSGTVEFISPIIDSSSGLRRCKILIDNSSGDIQAGLRASITLQP